MKETLNYKLKKPEASDNIINTWGYVAETIDTIDTTMKNTKDQADSIDTRVDTLETYIDSVKNTNPIVELTEAHVSAAKSKIFDNLDARLEETETDISGLGIRMTDAESDIATHTSQLADIVLNVKNFGAKGDGITDDTAAIQACINYVKHEQYQKGSARIFFPAPDYGQFYKISETLDFSEIWNVKIECPANYNYQRQALEDMDTDFALIHWYGTQDGIMLLFHYSYGLQLENITLNGRNIAGVGFSFSDTGLANSSTKFINGWNLSAKYCDVGVRVGDANAPDDFPVNLYNGYLCKNKSCGLKVNSGNAGVNCYSLTASQNGKTPTGTNKGCNIWLVTGELTLYSYGSDGEPVNSDIYQESGGLRIHSAWSDVSQGLFLDCVDATSSELLNGVRHYDGNMTTINTPLSIKYHGKQPLVMESCELFNSVEVNSGNQSHVIDIGTRFITAEATFIGDSVNTYRGYVGIGTSGQNESKISIGKPARSDAGMYSSLTVWSDNIKTNTVKSTLTDFVVTDILGSGDKSYHLLGNAYYDGVNYKAVKSGNCFRLYISGTQMDIGFATATTDGDTINFSKKFDIKSYYNGYMFGNGTNHQIWNTGVPIAGSYTKGDISWNTSATNSGDPTYYYRKTTGSANVLGTDWIGMAQLP